MKNHEGMMPNTETQNSPAQEQSSNTKNLAARTKEGQGLDFWANELHKNGKITTEVLHDFITKNNNKEQLLEEKGLPQLRHYGFFKSLNEIKDKLTEYKDERFIARCVNKKSGYVKRLIDIDLDGASDFVSALEGGFKDWNVEIKEFVNTIASGTIITDSLGKTIIETWAGPHYLNGTNVTKYSAEFDPESIKKNFVWVIPEDSDDPLQFQNDAMKALR